ncbi:MAG: MerC domain-containing protein [Spirosoma sp.]|nr:MerC domain-containing protein [Spirosoma sp.]
MRTDSSTNKADYVGITGSILCLIHCIGTPFLLVGSALTPHKHLTIGFLSLDYLFIGVNVIAVFLATRHYAQPVIKRALWGFLILFAGSLLLENVSGAFHYIGYLASAGLVLTHLTNIWQHRLNHTH